MPLARARTDAEGAFALDAVAFVAGVALEGDVPGFRRLHVELPDRDDLALRVVLESLAAEGESVAGVVRFADGAPAAGAWVSAGSDPTRAREDGSFVVATAPDARSVLAVHAGWQPARAELAELDERERRAVVLELGSPALALAGVVVDGEGRPLERAQVWTNGGEPFGMLSQRFGEVEFYVQKDVEELLAATATSTATGAGDEPRGRHVPARGPARARVRRLRAAPAHAGARVGARGARGEQGLRLVLAGAEPAREVRGSVETLAAARAGRADPRLPPARATRRGLRVQAVRHGLLRRDGRRRPLPPSRRCASLARTCS